MMEKTESEVTRLTNLLASAIKFSGWKQRDIEKTLGWSSGSMSRLLSGGIELKIKHVQEICGVIGFPAARFFHAAYPTADEGSPESARLQRLLEQLHPAEPEPEPAAAPAPAASSAVDATEVERIVFGALAKFFSNMGGPMGGQAPK
jgi:transcriptional regulator with XRE-family HTH domain